jgi:pyrimidine operon attenuation protein/uracil phosphoribosyltransferase
MKEKDIMTGSEIEKAIENIAKNIVKESPDIKYLVFIGILTRGVHIAQRLINEIKKIKKHEVPFGILDITFYRDDIDSIATQPLAKETKIMFDLTDKNVILVDDVLFTGRSIRAALDEIMDFGRPKKVQLAVLVDRGHRELPIQADFVGKVVDTEYTDRIHVKLKETDGTDKVVST